MGIRRVVTGHDETGKAIVVSDEEVNPTEPDYGQKWSIWAADRPATLPDDGAHPPFAGPLLPQPGGFHATVFTLPPSFNPDEIVDSGRVTAETHPVVADPNPPGSYGTLPGASGMHATPTIDCLMQLSGESVLVLEGVEVRLTPGDWVIVNGVMHSWRNDRDEPARLVGLVLGAHHKGAPVRARSETNQLS